MLRNITAVSLLLFSTALYAETLDEAIKRFVPTATDTIADVAPTEEVLIQAKAAVKAALLVDPDNEEIKKIAELLETLVAGEIISEEDREDLISKLAAFATANSAVYNSSEQHQLINSAIRSAVATLPVKMALMAFPTVVLPGGYSNLMWVSTHRNCQITGPDLDLAVVAAGNRRVGPLNNDSRFSLSCDNGKGGSNQKNILIKVRALQPTTTVRPDSTTPPKFQKAPKTTTYPVGKLAIVSASSSGFQKLSNGESYNASKAIDGKLDKTSRWSQKGISSNAKDYEWITLDLGVKRKLDTLRIAFFKYDQGRIYDYDIAVSNDNKNWKTVVKSAKSSASRWTKKSFNSETAQYVKVILNSASDNTSWANLFEIEVWNQEGMAASKKATLKWKASKGNVEGYKIFFGSSKEDTKNIRINVLRSTSPGFNMSAPSVTYNVNDLRVREGDQICFSIKAIGGSGQSDMSKPVCKVL